MLHMTFLQLKKAVKSEIENGTIELFINWINCHSRRDWEKDKITVEETKQLLLDAGFVVDYENSPQQTWKRGEVQ